ncbi:C4-dicarboxylate ABC transporter [Pontibacillus chungwhensis BH030062]|uniref:C4-dicarboxylate ABC transporter n=1 Tax=Pontibacillus chungwhensis BH030062 TaxID=1385513 RepID=A0A0A2VAF9_9BACI|nr:TRAP transporter permease [Pontibacillus chungwhensis]KGP90685.1 C4-dicarboxylate ABC transporter [Pontibacillus chungwhensis BH030062]
MSDKNNQDHTLSQEDQDALVKKYDVESSVRDLSGFVGKFVFFTLLAFSLYQVYFTVIYQIPAQMHRSIHLGFALMLIFLLFPARKKNLERGKLGWYDYLLAILSVGVGAYWPLNYDQIIARAGEMTQIDFYVGGLAILLVLEATRRAVGLPITIIASLFLAYAYWGRQMPDFLIHRGLDVDTIVQTMFFTTEGIFGTPLAVSSTFIFLFLLFGAFLVKTGVGQYFNDLAVALAGKRTGGPAKVAIFSSALQGTISGSSVANVVTSGSFTIPMMKRLGYRKEFSGAVEAAASTGGQLMPPIMGAAAFLMIEFIGIDYWSIAKAAAIPAILYFTGIWIMTHFEAKRIGLRGLDDEEVPDKKEVLKKLYLLLPIVAIVFFLASGLSIILSALYGIFTTILVGLLREEKFRKIYPIAFAVGGIAYIIYKAIVNGGLADGWFVGGLIAGTIATIVVSYFFDGNFADTIDALVQGARTALGVVAATAAAGMIVGVVTKTGLGLKLANSLVSLANEQILLTLFFTMVAAIILGMGSPTTANYVITSTIAAPAIIALGVMELPAHLFVFYFGIIADITPPVALAAFAASGVSGGEPIRTGVNAAKLAIAAFIIPYMFVLQPELLMIDATFWGLIWILFTAIAGMIAIGAGMIGYWFRKVYWVERILAVGGGLALIYPGGYSDTIGLVVFGGILGAQFLIKRELIGKPMPQRSRA